MEEKSAVSSGQKTSVLLIEGNLEDAEFVEKSLSKIWCSVVVHSTPNNDEALSFLDKHTQPGCMSPPDLILLGFDMPIIEALDFISKKQQNKFTRDVPVVALSNLNNVTEYAILSELGITAVVSRSSFHDQMNHVSKLMVSYWFEGQITL